MASFGIGVSSSNLYRIEEHEQGKNRLLEEELLSKILALTCNNFS